jgi:NAD+-processing family protein with receiver domain
VKLYVDDLRRCPEGWTLARTNTEAIRLLASGFVEEISIDHDICVLNFNTISEPVRRRLAIGEETFMPIIYYIALMKPEDRPKKITIHTANPAAAIRMAGILKDAAIESETKESDCPFDLGENEK